MKRWRREMHDKARFQDRFAKGAMRYGAVSWQTRFVFYFLLWNFYFLLVGFIDWLGQALCCSLCDVTILGISEMYRNSRFHVSA